jgi:pyrroloquinoline-quinone synthase
MVGVLPDDTKKKAQKNGPKKKDKLMSFATELLVELAPKHLLKHPFYQEWTCGHLTMDQLRTYARQYFQHVKEFPRFVSATHSNCGDIKARQILLENLNDEERGDNNHPELWLRFAEGIGETRDHVENEKTFAATQKLIDTFMRLGKSSYEEGLGALFAYESQIPEIAASKIDGLKKFYGIHDERTLSFFEVHLQADVWHSQAVAGLMNQLDDVKREKAKRAAKEIADCLWDLLSGVYQKVA